MPARTTRRTHPRRWLRRHRRPLAAAAAGLASVTAIIALRGGPPPTSTDAAPATARAEQTLVPVTLSVPGIAGALRPGDVVDLVAIADDGSGRVVASGARVVGRPGSTTLISGSAGSAILMAVPPEDAISLAATAAAGTLTAVIREQAATG